MKKIFIGMLIAIVMIAPVLPTPAHAQAAQTPATEAQIEVLKQELISLLTQLIANLKDQLETMIAERDNMNDDMADDQNNDQDEDQISGGESEPRDVSGDLRDRYKWFPRATVDVRKDEQILIVSFTDFFENEEAEVKVFDSEDGEKGEKLDAIARLDADYEKRCEAPRSEHPEVQKCSDYPTFDLHGKTEVIVEATFEGDTKSIALKKRSDGKWTGGNSMIHEWK